MTASTAAVSPVRLSLSHGVEMFRLCVLYTCLLSPILAYRTDSDILYKAEETSSFSHKILIRQTNKDEARTLFGQRPARQLQQCRGPGGPGRCVPVESCVLQDINKDYIKNKDYFCIMRNQGGIGVCCPDSVTTPVTYKEGIFSQSSGNMRPTRSPQGQPMPQQQQQGSITAAGSSGGYGMDDAYPLGDYRVCGRNGKKISRITSGAPTTVKDWPWMAALIYRQSLKQFCGGTIITKRHVLTAAHCFPRPDPNEVLLILGDYDLKRQDDSKSKIFTVVQIIVHEDYDVTTFENDIAILVMNTSTIYNSYIQPCCLPAPGPRYPNLTTVVTGWGKTEFGGPSSNVLMEVPVPIWEQEKCTPNFAQTVFDTNMCAGGFEGGKDACQGDSGGPLVMQRKDERWAVVGIVSWGIRCGEKNKPGIYTRVNDYLDWIAQTIL